jgi:hypothetical protein
MLSWAGISPIALLYACAGCATSIVAVRPLPPEKEAAINATIADKRVTLELASPAQPLDARVVRLDASSVRFQERDPASPWHLSSWLPESEAPLASVQSIKVRDHGRGALHGLAIGGTIGAVSGVIAGVVYNRGYQFDSFDSNILVPLYGALAFGIGSGLIGALVGAAIGSPTTIEFKDASTH